MEYAAGFLNEETEDMRETKRSEGFSLLAKHIQFMAINQVTEICFISTGVCLEIGEYIQISGCLSGRVDKKGVGKQKRGLL